MAGQLSSSLLLAVPLAPLAGSAIAGLLGTKFLGNVVGRKVSHTVTILGVAIALVISVMTLMAVLGGAEPSTRISTPGCRSAPSNWRSASRSTRCRQ
jgi:NADH-quinone oxidoreductase subunit L